MRRLPGAAAGPGPLLILVLFQTGLRISEALSLTVGHLARQPGALEVMGKGGKLRLVACPAAPE